MVWTPFTQADHDRSGQRYASGMADREWSFNARFMPPQPLRGRRRKTDLRSVVAAIFYVPQLGCQLNLLPKYSVRFAKTSMPIVSTAQKGNHDALVPDNWIVIGVHVRKVLLS